jgi:peptidoglycan/xylan/chitin deacetylase (PgdA/CDA1 family)
MNAAVAERYPMLMREVVSRGHEVVAHGQDMGTLHHSGLSAEEEGAIVSRSLGILREAAGQPVTGWLSPGRAQSFATPDILAAHGVSYACDWANDDMPFAMRTAHGPLWAMPLAQETEDRAVLLDFHHTEDDWLLQLKDRFDVLYREADRFGGRIVSVPLHAWTAGVPYRIGIVREALSYMLGHDAVWAATGAEILAAFQAASGKSHG